MNFHRQKYFNGAVRCLLAVMALLVFCAVGNAQPAKPGRWLLVFDTSVTMKKRLPGATEALNQFLKSGADGQLQAGDEMALWLYSQQLQPGLFPLTTWNAAKSAEVSSNMVSLIRRQRFTDNSSFAPLVAPLNQVVGNSERLTIVIVCDGLSEINFTPYDEGINQNFRDGLVERKKTQQPFVVVLRSQLGKFVGCTVSFPPGDINLPSFPPLPLPAPPVTIPTPAPVPVVTHPVAIPDLVIVGKKVGTNESVAPETVAQPIAPAVVATNPSPVNPPVVTTPVAPPPVKVVTPVTVPPPVIKPVVPPVVVVTQVVVKPVVTVVTQIPPPVAAAPVMGTNMAALVAPAENGGQTKMFVFIGVVLLLMAVGLVLVIVRAGRRPQASLISSSMDNDPRRK